MSEVADERRVYAAIGDLFDFEEIATPETFDLISDEDSRRAYAMYANYRFNMRRLRESDLPAQTKRDIVVISRQAHIDRFIEWGVPRSLAWILFNFGMACDADNDMHQ